MLNWQKPRSWTDYQNAKFLYLVDGKGQLYVDNIRQASRFIACSEAKLVVRLQSVKSATYSYPMQWWEGEYKLFEKNKIVIKKKKTLMEEIVKFKNGHSVTDNG